MGEGEDDGGVAHEEIGINRNTSVKETYVERRLNGNVKVVGIKSSAVGHPYRLVFSLNVQEKQMTFFIGSG